MGPISVGGAPGIAGIPANNFNIPIPDGGSIMQVTANECSPIANYEWNSVPGCKLLFILIVSIVVCEIILLKFW